MKTLPYRCAQRFSALLEDTRGSTLMLVGLGIFALMGAAGSAIDMGRAQMVQAKLSASLDAAGLAAGAVANSQDIDAEAQKYFDANFPQNYLDSNLTDFDVDFDPNTQIITLSATADVETNFMQVFGIEQVTVAATSEITRANKGMELVLVLDNTTSMISPNPNKLPDMKAAAIDLMNILYGDRETLENVWVGLVPFSQAVNIGSSRAAWTSGSPNWGTTSWAGCVDARETSGRDITDDPPSVALFPKYYWPCHTSYNAWYGTNSSRNNCQTSPSSSLRYKSGLGTSLGPNKSCPQPVTPLTASKTTVINNINAMQAVGYTHTNLGLVWGWRMLSPRWRGLWGGEMDTENLPLDYHTALMNKVVVFMTDGENTHSNSVRSAYGYLSQGILGTTSTSGAEDELDNRLEEVCEDMKEQGIIIYTIMFDLNSTSVANLFRGCATKPEYFFDAPTPEDLEQAFHTIGDSLANLRISK